MVTVLIGNNDVCANSFETMTDPVQFEADTRAGLDIGVNGMKVGKSGKFSSKADLIYYLQYYNINVLWD